MADNVKRISPSEGIAKVLDILVSGDDSHRGDVFNDKIGEITIDTCLGVDTGKWETGIDRGDWIIVEQYPSRIEAEKGHKKWVSAIQADPNCELSDIGLWGIGVAYDLP